MNNYFAIIFFGLQILLPVVVGISCWMDMRAYRRLVSRIYEVEADLTAVVAELNTSRQTVLSLGKILAGRGYGRYKFDGETHTLEYGKIKEGKCVVKFWSSDFSDKEHGNDQAPE